MKDDFKIIEKPVGIENNRHKGKILLALETLSFNQAIQIEAEDLGKARSIQSQIGSLIRTASFKAHTSTKVNPDNTVTIYVWKENK